MSQQPILSISIVSHGQGTLVAALLADIVAHGYAPIEVLLTVNVPEPLPFNPASFPFPVTVIRNTVRRGYATNHNAAAVVAGGRYFCVLNPDIRLVQNPWPRLIEQLEDESVGVVGPLIVSPSGQIEDSARRFPTPVNIFKKAFLGSPGVEYAINTEPLHPDWIGGMFMVFRTALFRFVGGFDERYFLYYEDVDLCWRLSRAGFRVLLMPSERVVHAAQRTSHRNPVYLKWHVCSMLRFFGKRYAPWFFR